MQREARMVEWKIVYTRQAQRDARKIAAAALRPKAEKITRDLIPESLSDPSNLRKACGRPLRRLIRGRINIQHRLVYQILEEQRTVKVITDVDALRVVWNIPFRHQS